MAPSIRFPGTLPAPRETMRSVHRHFAAFMVFAAMAGSVAPAADALQSPLSLLKAPVDHTLAVHPSDALSQLIRLTHTRRNLVAAQLPFGGIDRSALARIDTQQHQLLQALLDGTPALEKADLRALQSEWDALAIASAHPSADAAALFAHHTRLIDRQIELRSRVAPYGG